MRIIFIFLYPQQIYSLPTSWNVTQCGKMKSQIKVFCVVNNTTNNTLHYETKLDANY